MANICTEKIGLFNRRNKMKTIKLTAEFTSSITREIEVEDDFNSNDCDLDDLWYQNGGYGATKKEISTLIGNSEMDEVWLVRDENDNEIYVK